MTTASIEPEQQLEQGIERIEKEIETTRVDIAEWETRERECNSLLASLRAQYVEAAGLKVQGKSAPVDKLASQIETLKEQSIGFAHVIGVKREQLGDLQSRLQPLHVEQSQRAQARMIAEEKAAIEKMVKETDQALADLNAAAQKFANGVTAIRQHVYINEANKHYGFDEAFRLQRLSQGQRP